MVTFFILFVYIVILSFIISIILVFLELFVSTNNYVLIKSINEILPQTQCGKCGYSGCFPYAKAIVEKNDMINKCVPGNKQVLIEISNLLNKKKENNIFELTYKKNIAFIEEKNCIGCAKCIKLCPVDAIVGSVRHVHTVLSSLCTGCELCIKPCPTDCISLIEIKYIQY